MHEVVAHRLMIVTGQTQDFLDNFASPDFLSLSAGVDIIRKKCRINKVSNLGIPEQEDIGCVEESELGHGSVGLRPGVLRGHKALQLVVDVV